MKVRKLINRLLEYDMNANVELTIFALDQEQEQFTCLLKEKHLEGGGKGPTDLGRCSIIFEPEEFRDFCGSTLLESLENEEFYFEEYKKTNNIKDEEDFDESKKRRLRKYL
jgi:hypothetical protein